MGFAANEKSQALQDAVEYAWAKGSVLVAAAGNTGDTTVNYPAGAAKVVGVANTTSGDTVAASSTRGESAFMAAPGEGVTAAAVGGGVKTISGTSASSAVVAGSAALLAALDADASNGTIVGRLARNADPAGSTSETGNGRVNVARSAGDTSTDAVVPAGAAAEGTSGPIVGPYVAAESGDGQGAVSPASTSVEVSSLNNTLTFTFTAKRNQSGVGPAIEFLVPSGWSEPQTGNRNLNGYVRCSR